MAISRIGEARYPLRDEHAWESEAADTEGDVTIDVDSRLHHLITLKCDSGTCVPMITGYATGFADDLGVSLVSAAIPAAASHNFAVDGAYRRLEIAFGSATDRVVIAYGGAR